MQLRPVKGNLVLGSVYRLFVWRRILSWNVFAGVILLVIVLITLATAQMTLNGEIVQERGPAVMAMLSIPVLFSIVIVLQAFKFGGFLTIGPWPCRLRRPLQVVPESGAPSS